MGGHELEKLPDWIRPTAERRGAPVALRNHNQYCRDDWAMYRGDGPRGMGPNGDGCVCDLWVAEESERRRLAGS